MKPLSRTVWVSGHHSHDRETSWVCDTIPASKPRFGAWVLGMVLFLAIGGLSTPVFSQPTATFSGHSETLLRFYQQEQVDRIKNLLALIEILSISADFPKIPDFSIQLSGWGQLDLIDVSQQNRLTGDLNLATISYRDPKMRFEASLGRQYLYQDNRVLHFDGARLEGRTPFGLAGRVFAGWVVRPQFASPNGYFVAGARLSHRIGHITEIGVTFLDMLEEGRPAHQLLGFDLWIAPLRWLEITANVSADLHLLALRQAGGRIDIQPWRWLRFSLGYDYAMPSAFVSKDSIFSVFSNNTYHEGYVQAWLYFLQNRLSLGVDLRLLFLPDDDSTRVTTAPTTTYATTPLPTGEQIRLHARFQYQQRPSGWIGLTLERLRDQEDGHWGMRAFWQQQWAAFLLAADVQYYYYARNIRGYPHSFYSALSGQWQFAKGWALTASVQFTLNPFVEQSWLGLLKLSYQFYAEVPPVIATSTSSSVQPGKSGGKP